MVDSVVPSSDDRADAGGKGPVPLASPEESNDSFDLKSKLQVVVRRKWLVLLVFASVVGSVSLYTVRQPKVYRAEVSIIIDPKEPRFLDSQIQDVNADTYSTYWGNKEYVETQLKVITSRVVAQRVVDKLGLARDPAFLGLSQIADENRRNEVMKAIDAASILRAKVKVEPQKDSRLAYIRVEDLDANRAALLANEVAQAYVDEMLSQRLAVTDNALKWLDERRDSLSTEARESELELYNFRKQADMLTTSLDDRASMVSSRLQSTSTALNDVKLKIAGLRARVAAIRAVQANQGADDVLWAEALPAARENANLSEYKKRVLTLKSECADLQARYLDSHPKLAECQDKLAVAEKDFARELSNLVISTEAELKEALEKEKNIAGLFGEARQEAFEVEKKKLELDRLRQEADSNKRQYEAVFKRLKDIELSGLLRTSNVRVLDPARPMFGPIRPKVPQAVAIGAVMGLLLGLALAFLLDFLDSSVNSQQEIEDRLGLTFLGFLPTIPEATATGARDLHIFREPKSLIAECTRAVRTNLLFMSPDKPFKRLLVTSSGPQEGKSTIVINLGITMAQNGARVLIIDTDMRRPRLHKAFGVPNDVGVSSLVVGEGDVTAAIKSTEVPGLFVLPCGPVPPNPAELLHTEAFTQLLTQLGENFDRILLDSPPVGPVADAVVLATQVDGVVVVLKAGATNREVAKRTVHALKDVNAVLFGAVLNDVSLEKARYGDYYSYAQRYYGYSEQNKEA